MSEKRLTTAELLREMVVVLRVLRECMRDPEKKSQSSFRSHNERFQQLVTRWREIFTNEFDTMKATAKLAWRSLTQRAPGG